MLLYHGSNVIVRRPRLLPKARALDFGAGFYLTSDYEQAAKWAGLTAKRRRSGKPYVSVYRVDDVAYSKLHVMRYEKPDADWLRYISANRKNEFAGDDWDVVAGPVANDNTMPVLNLYMKGAYTEEEAIRRLLPQKLKDQYAFKTERSLACFVFQEVIEP